MSKLDETMTLEELADIEARLDHGETRAEDARRLVQTVRKLLGEKKAAPAEKKPRVAAGKAIEGAVSGDPDVPLPSWDQSGQVEIFTDGACQGNPGPGGWGALLRSGGGAKELSGYERQTTNNRMELTAVIRALEELRGRREVTVCTDSQYVKKGITEWIKGWKANGWRTAARTPVKNAELWRELDELNRSHNVTWQWTRGHSGHPENERCDELARMAIATRGR